MGINMKNESNLLLNELENNPIIAAIKDDDGLEVCIKSECKIVFVLFGTVTSIPSIIHKLKANSKIVFVHLDLIDGLSSKEAAVEYLKKSTQADGIISTKINLLKIAKQKGFITIQRIFLLDSLALSNVLKSGDNPNVDFIEILPGLMHKITRQLTKKLKSSIISGGLISDKEDIVSALKSGSVAASTTKKDLWFV